MSAKVCYRTQSKFCAIVLMIMSQFLQIHARFVLSPKISESKPVLSWEDNDYKVSAPLIPGDCEQGYLCDRVGNYPTSLAAMILTTLNLKNITKFADDQIDESEYDDFGEIQELCETSKEKTIMPLAAKDYKNEWQFILNMPSNRFQSFRVDKCRNTGEVSCSSAAYISDTNNYRRINCEQIFTKRKMVYLDLEKKIVAADYFTVPSCCSCYLESS